MKTSDIIKGKVKLGDFDIIIDEEGNQITNTQDYCKNCCISYHQEKHNFLNQFIVDAINEKIKKHHV